MKQKQYKLKKEARQFFKQTYATFVQDLSGWNLLCVSQELLEEVHQISIGQTRETYEMIGNEAAGKIAFTLQINDISKDTFDKIKVGELMDDLQKVAQVFCLQHNIIKA